MQPRTRTGKRGSSRVFVLLNEKQKQLGSVTYFISLSKKLTIKCFIMKVVQLQFQTLLRALSKIQALENKETFKFKCFQVCPAPIRTLFKVLKSSFFLCMCALFLPGFISPLLCIPVGEGLHAKTCHQSLHTAWLNKGEKSNMKNELKEFKSTRSKRHSSQVWIDLAFLVWEVDVRTS